MKGLGLILGSIVLCITFDSFSFLHQGWFTMSRIPFWCPSRLLGFLHKRSTNKLDYFIRAYLAAILIHLIFLFGLGKSVVFPICLGTFGSCFENKKEGIHKPFHKVKHLIHRNRLKNHGLIFISSQETYTLIKIKLAIIFYNKKFKITLNFRKKSKPFRLYPITCLTQNPQF
jgi:hypothetical protein